MVHCAEAGFLSVRAAPTLGDFTNVKSSDVGAVESHAAMLRGETSPAQVLSRFSGSIVYW